MKEEVETKPVTMYNFFQDYIQLQTITQNINFRKKRTSCIFSWRKKIQLEICTRHQQ